MYWIGLDSKKKSKINNFPEPKYHFTNMCGEIQIKICTFFTSALKVSGQFHALVSLVPAIVAGMCFSD
jgi:hypothetical protein